MSAPLPHMSSQDCGERLLQKVSGDRFPLSGQWELTCRCNLACVMCYTDPLNTPERLRQELRYEDIVRIMGEVQEAGCVELCLTGGEPLSRSDFLDIYRHAKRLGFLIIVFTNGTLISKKIADYWAEYPPSMIEISVHGLTKATFESVTKGHRSYEHCLLGIKLLLERNLPLTLKTTGMTVNHDEILRIKEYVNGLGNVRYKFSSDIRPRLDGSDDVYQYQLEQHDITRIEQSDREFREERLRQSDAVKEAVAEGKELCRGGKHKFHIDAYGRLQLCSNNRAMSYDLRRGSFREGFYEVLPKFPCPSRPAAKADGLLSIERPEKRRKAVEVLSL